MSQCNKCGNPDTNNLIPVNNGPVCLRCLFKEWDELKLPSLTSIPPVYAKDEVMTPTMRGIKESIINKDSLLNSKLKEALWQRNVAPPAPKPIIVPPIKKSPAKEPEIPTINFAEIAKKIEEKQKIVDTTEVVPLKVVTVEPTPKINSAQTVKPSIKDVSTGRFVNSKPDDYQRCEKCIKNHKKCKHLLKT